MAHIICHCIANNMWKLFKKKSGTKDEESPNKMGMMQMLAMKKIAKMNPQERNKMMQEAMKPENREQIMKVLDFMKKSGQLTDDQMAQAKKMFGSEK